MEPESDEYRLEDGAPVLHADDIEDRTDAFKLLADYGLADGAYRRIKGAQEAIFAEYLQRGEPITDWSAFVYETLRRAKVYQPGDA